MFRVIVPFLVVAGFAWAPWMDTDRERESIERTFDAFGPVAASCYDQDGTVLLEGLTIRWYPLGRMIHTCEGDFVVWFWGDVKELGGVTKRAADIAPQQMRDLSCTEILDRATARLASSTTAVSERFTGAAAPRADFSQFPDAAQYRTQVEAALTSGPNFAGTFAVAEWECGTGCQNHAVVHVQTGKVVAYGPMTEYGVSYTLGDTLLVTNPLDKLPEAPESNYEAESQALSIARVPREYYRLTKDTLSGTEYLVKLCVESAGMGYIGVEEDRLGVPSRDGTL